MLIQVDVDNTLYNSDKVFKEVAAEYGIKWPTKYYHWFGPQDIGTDLQTLKAIFRKAHSRDFVMQQKPYPKAAETLGRIASTIDNVEIAYISDRNVQQTSALRDWLDQHGFLFSEDQRVETTKDKRHWMREHKPEIVIDDRVRTMLLARYELGAYVVGLKFGYNMNLSNEAPGIYLADDWEQIDQILWNDVLPLTSSEVSMGMVKAGV